MVCHWIGYPKSPAGLLIAAALDWSASEEARRGHTDEAVEFQRLADWWCREFGVGRPRTIIDSKGPLII